MPYPHPYPRALYIRSRAYTVHAHIRSSRTPFTAREITSISRKKNGRPNEGKKVQGHEDKPAEKTAGYRKKNKSKGTKKDQAQVIKRKDTHKGKQSIRPRLSMHHAAIVTRKGQKMRINPPPRPCPLIRYKHGKMESVHYTHPGRGRYH